MSDQVVDRFHEPDKYLTQRNKHFTTILNQVIENLNCVEAVLSSPDYMFDADVEVAKALAAPLGLLAQLLELMNKELVLTLLVQMRDTLGAEIAGQQADKVEEVARRIVERGL